MQLLWHCLVNMSFGYLSLIALTRIAQETAALFLPRRRRETLASNQAE